MRALLSVLALAVCSACQGQPQPLLPGVPMPSGYVVDQVGVLDAETARTLTDRLARLDSATTAQVVVVVLPDLGGETAAGQSGRIAEAWGVGRAGVNNGAVLLLAMAERETWISVGTGLEWQVPDSVASRIVADAMPAFRRGDFGAGVTDAVEALAERAGSVPWRVAYPSAAAVRAAGDEAVGEVAVVEGVWDGSALVSDGAPVAVRFPPHWPPALVEGDGVRLVARVEGVSPLRVQLLGGAP